MVTDLCINIFAYTAFGGVIIGISFAAFGFLWIYG